MNDETDRTGQRRAPARRVTIRDVARAAGVSIATASKALNARGRMTDETRERIRRAAQDLGFRPNALARGLLARRSFTIGLLTTDTYGRFTLPVAAGVSDALVDKGVSVFLSAVDGDAARGRINLEAMQEKCVDGIIVAGKRIDRRVPLDLSNLGLPVVHVYSKCEDNEIGFMPDDRQGASIAVEHMIANGRKRIAHVSGPADFKAVDLRRDGWLRALESAGLSGAGEALLGEWSEDWGYRAGHRLVGPGSDRGTRPDAIFCGNDQIARGIIDALTALGVGVPDDVAVVGFDNWEVFAAATRPPLTTVDMELQNLGRLAGLTLLDLVDGKAVEPGLRHTPCTLVIRQSGGAQSPP